MPDILVIHPHLDHIGGSEQVCMHVLEALQNDYNTTLITFGKTDLDKLNNYYGTDVSNITVQRIVTRGLISSVTKAVPGPDMGKLVDAIRDRTLNTQISSSYDVIISTKGIRQIDHPAIEYIHHPMKPDAEKNKSDTRKNFPTPAIELYDNLCNSISPTISENTEIRFFANSQWTASFATDVLNTSVDVIYPPVYTKDISPKTWESRDDRILSIGQITPSKNIIRNIKIISILFDRGHSIEYDIVGPPSGPKKYVEKVKQEVDRREFVNYLGPVSRERLTQLLSTYKYGLHGHNEEHFGIAVAELVAGGVIPFVPNEGGQREIVGQDERLMYTSSADAVDLMDSVLQNEQKQKDIRASLPNINERFGRDRFKNEIRESVANLF